MKEAGVTLVLANWTFSETRDWQGAGGTRIIGADGEVITQIRHDFGNGIVIADIPIAKGAH